MPYAGGFNAAAFSADFELVSKGELQQVAIVEIDVNAVGKEFQLNLPMACNAFTLIAAVVDENGTAQFSSTVAAIGLRFNDRNQKAMLFSLAGGPGSVGASLQSFTGTIIKIYCRVVTPEVGKKIYAVALLAAGISTQPGASGYNPPAGISPGGGGGGAT